MNGTEENANEENRNVARADLTLPLYMPIVRFDPDNWTVTGQATVEDVDTYGTEFEYEASKRAFTAWRGNVREMHDSKKAVGRAVDVTFDDAAKAIFVTTRVSRGAADTWQKVKDGVLTGYSVGAWAGKDDWEEVSRNGKTIPRLKNYKLIELSLVDHPATPGCSFEIVRADGMGNGQVLADDESIEQEETARAAAGNVTAQADPTDARAGAKVSHVTQDSLHSVRNSALNQAKSVMQICADGGCEDCQAGLSALDPDNDGDIDILPSLDYDGDKGQSDMMAGYRVLEPSIQRAMQPVFLRMNGILSQIIQAGAANAHNTTNDAKIEERLASFEAARAADTAKLESLLSDLKGLTERIATTPQVGGPIANFAAYDKRLATQDNGRPQASSLQADTAELVRRAKAGELTTQDEQTQAAAALVKLQMAAQRY